MCVRGPQCKPLVFRYQIYPVLITYSSCALCRRKKIRCNRETPCSNCIRFKTESCTYETQISREPRSCTQRPISIQPRHDTTGSTTTANVPSRLSLQDESSSTNTRTDGSSHAAFELEAMRARITELEDELARANSRASSPYSVVASTPVSTYSVRTVSCLASTIDVLQEIRAPGGAAIARGIVHKNRLFGQSHWMNGFIIVRILRSTSNYTQVLTPLLSFVN